MFKEYISIKILLVRGYFGIGLYVCYTCIPVIIWFLEHSFICKLKQINMSVKFVKTCQKNSSGSSSCQNIKFKTCNNKNNIYEHIIEFNVYQFQFDIEKFKKTFFFQFTYSKYAASNSLGLVFGISYWILKNRIMYYINLTRNISYVNYLQRRELKATPEMFHTREYLSIILM